MIRQTRPIPAQVGVNLNRPPQIMEQMTLPRGRNGPPPVIATRAVNGNGAPVCPITRSQVPPAQPGIRVPAIPPATDIPSAIAAINRIITIINDTTPHIKWIEAERVTARVRIFNPDDDNQWVDVIRIMKLIMEDQDTGDLWVWEL